MLERDLHLADFEVKQNSPSIGKTLRELNFRKHCNVNIVTIIRGDNRINIPGGEEHLYPFDKIVVAGSDSDLEHFRTYVEEKYQDYKAHLHPKANIQQSGIRDKADCLVIGIERGNTSLKNPDPSMQFQEGDLVWIVGERSKVLRFSESNTL